jgi:hypothetical protein
MDPLELDALLREPAADDPRSSVYSRAHEPVSAQMNKVAIIVSPFDSEAAVLRVARDSPVWVCRSPETEQIASAVRRAGGEVTVFTAEGDRQVALLSIIDEVELHHGAHSSRPVVAIDVRGATLSDAIRARFEALGYRRFEARRWGFVAYLGA